MPSIGVKLGKGRLVAKHDLHPLVLGPVLVLVTKNHSVANVLGT